MTLDRRTLFKSLAAAFVGSAVSRFMPAAKAEVPKPSVDTLRSLSKRMMLAAPHSACLSCDSWKDGRCDHQNRLPPYCWHRTVEWDYQAMMSVPAPRKNFVAMP